MRTDQKIFAVVVLTVVAIAFSVALSYDKTEQRLVCSSGGEETFTSDWVDAVAMASTRAVLYIDSTLQGRYTFAQGELCRLDTRTVE